MRVIASLTFVLLLATPVTAQTPPAPPAAPTPPGVVLTAPSYSRYERATGVELRDVAAFVLVRPENRPDVSVAINNPGPLASPRIRLAGDTLIIDGGLRRQIRSCETQGADGFEVRTRRNGTLDAAQLPTIELRVPQNVALATGGAVRLRMAPAVSAQVRVDGCGDADIERVENELSAAVAGAVDLRIYDAGQVSAAVAGAGDVTLGVARQGLTVSIAGAGDFTAARADGPTSIAIQGAGDVTIRDGRATALNVAIVGAGDVTHNGSAERLDVAIFGGGDVHVRQVDGPVSRRVIGGGDVTIGR